MINQNELRVGNYVRMYPMPNKFSSQIGRVKEILNTGCWAEFDDGFTEFGRFKFEVEPISLCKNWIDKFGFDDSEYKDGYIGVDYKKNLIMDFVLTKPKLLGEWQDYYVYDLGNHRFVGIHYVHELQNLFFAITTTELKLKQIEV